MYSFSLYWGKVTKHISLEIGNFENRYPTGYDKSVFKCYRGAWDADSLSGKLFYAGDEVIDDTDFLSKGITGGGGGNLDYYGIYKWIGGIGTGTLAPQSDPLSWEKVAITV